VQIIFIAQFRKLPHRMCLAVKRDFVTYLRAQEVVFSRAAVLSPLQLTASVFISVAENEPLDTWDEEETILTPDGDNENDDEVRESHFTSHRVVCLLTQELRSVLSPQDMDVTDEGDSLPKPSTKRKVQKVEENCSKKEHVNVVFIGHVGMCISLAIPWPTYTSNNLHF
jgi:hypothetical protein